MFLTIVRPSEQSFIDWHHRRLADRFCQIVNLYPSYGAVFILTGTKRQRLVRLKEVGYVEMQMACNSLSPLDMRPDGQDFHGSRAVSKANEPADTGLLLRFPPGDRFEIAF